MSTVPDSPPDPNEKWWQNKWVQMTITNIVTALLTVLVTWAARPAAKRPKIDVKPSEPEIVRTGGMGWINDPVAVNAAIPQIAAQQGVPAEFSDAAKGLMQAADNDQSVFNWQAEQKVLGKILPSWDQGAYGTCTSFGYARGCQDLMLIRVAEGLDGETWPGPEVATEPIYGGSRVEIGQGRAGRGDGSTGAWCAQWVQTRGLLFRQKYNGVDLSSYSGSLSRKWGRSGVPDDLERIAKEHPVTTVARLANATELWAALGSAYPVPVCSDVGFEGRPPADGIMSPRGQWGHCMLFRGRFVSPSKGKCLIIQNSWGNYLGKRLKVKTADQGEVELPEGCFAVTLATADRMVREGDTFAISALKGFPKRRIPWENLVGQNTRTMKIAEPLFALAP